MSVEENKELNKVEKRLKELSKCELFLDNILIKDKTARQILVSAYNKLEKQQKEIEELHKEINRRIKLKIENEKCVDRDFIYKGKIREKIEELKEIADEDNPDIYIKIDAYQELLEENNNE